MKILITDSVILNGGDAAIILSIVNSLKKIFNSDKINIKVLAHQVTIAKKYYKDLDLLPPFAEAFLFNVNSRYHKKILAITWRYRVILFALVRSVFDISLNILLTEMEKK